MPQDTYSNSLSKLLDILFRTKPIAEPNENIDIIKSKLKNIKCMLQTENNVSSNTKVTDLYIVQGLMKGFQSTKENNHMAVKLESGITLCVNVNNLLIITEGKQSLLGKYFIRQGVSYKIESKKIDVLNIKYDNSEFLETDYDPISTKKIFCNSDNPIIFFKDPSSNFAFSIYKKTEEVQNGSSIYATIIGIQDVYTSKVVSYYNTTDSEINNSLKPGIQTQQQPTPVPETQTLNPASPSSTPPASPTPVGIPGYSVTLVDGNCYVINTQNGGNIRLNKKSRAMYKIRFDIPNPEVFIIGKYASPKAPFIVLPVMKSWINNRTITFPTKDGRTLVVYHKHKELLVSPTSGNASDVFIIKHIVKSSRSQKGGGPDFQLRLLIPDEKKICVAEEILFTKQGNGKYFSKTTNETGTLNKDTFSINKNNIYVNYNTKYWPNSITLYKYKNEYFYALVSTPQPTDSLEPQQPTDILKPQPTKLVEPRSNISVSLNEIKSIPAKQITFEIIETYIKSLKSDIEFWKIKMITKDNIDKIVNLIDKLQDGNDKQNIDALKNSFNEDNENNQIGLLIKLYKVNKLLKTKSDISGVLSAIHDGWVLSHLISTISVDNSNGILYKFGQNYNNKIDNDDITILNVENIDNYITNNSKDLVKIKIDGYSTIITGDQVCMMVPYEYLSEENKKLDFMFLKRVSDLSINMDNETIQSFNNIYAGGKSKKKLYNKYLNL